MTEHACACRQFRRLAPFAVIRWGFEWHSPLGCWDCGEPMQAPEERN